MKQSSVAILTTPSFTTWLEDDDFLAKFLQSILGIAKNRSSSLDANVVSAVVDRLPTLKHDGSPG